MEKNLLTNEADVNLLLHVLIFADGGGVLQSPAKSIPSE